jgi:uncharacterized protein
VTDRTRRIDPDPPEIPTRGQIRALHERYAPTTSAFELVWTHCEIVCAIAEQLLGTYRGAIDAELVRAGCLLHDIGVYLLYDDEGRLDHSRYVRHGVLGDGLLRDLGFADRLRRFCSHHTGTGISRDDIVRQALPLPAGDYLAETDEERLVMYADKFHSKTTPPTFLTAATYAAGLSRFGADKPAQFADLVAQFGHPDLATLVRDYQHPLR